jgi:hypothetical protein
MIHNKAIFTIFSASRIANHETQIKKFERLNFMSKTGLDEKEEFTPQWQK